MKAIVVVDENWAIGKDGGLLVHLPGDLKYFKEKTVGKTVIMGRVTLESLPGKRPLPDRKTIVLSRSELQGDFITCHSVEAVQKEVEESGCQEDVFVAGGQRVYEQLLPLCDEVYVTKIARTFDGADSFFPNLEKDQTWEMEFLGEPVTEKEITYQFVVYRRK